MKGEASGKFTGIKPKVHAKKERKERKEVTHFLCILCAPSLRDSPN
jgi:hypothetical protein